ncbi:MAG: hypothetical protein LUD78_09040 [Clostridiales bacterium]|nr:hypothetical protein [Clostridiales bacterium]
MAKELKIQMTLDASGVKSGAKEAERALDSVSDAAEETGESAGKSSASFQAWGKKVSNVGKTLKYDLTSSTKVLQEQYRILQDGLLSGDFTGGALKEAKTALWEIGAELENRTRVSGIGEEAKVANEYIVQLAEEMRTLTAQKKELEKAGTILGYEEYDKTLQRLKELRAEMKAYQSYMDLSNSPDSYTATIKAIKDKMALLETSGEGFGTDFYDELYQELLRTAAAQREYKQALADTVAQENASADNMTAQLAQAQAELSSLASAGLGFGDEDYDAQYQEVVRLTAELKEYKKALDEGATATENQSSVLSRLATAGKTAASAVASLASKALSAAKGGLFKLGSTLSNLAGKAGSAALSGLKSVASRVTGIGSSAKSTADGGLSNMVRQIRNIGVVSLGLKLCTSLFGRLRSVVSNYVSENEELSNSVTQLKNGLGQALAPAINLVVNAMSKLLPYIIGVADAIASLITNIFGVGWTSVSTGASTAADAVDDVADATDDATAAQEAYNRTVEGFDEINKLNDNSSSSGSSGTGSTGATTSTTDGTEGIAGILPEWLANIASLIENSEWAELGTYLADCLGGAVDKIYDVLTSETTYAKIDSAVNALTTTVNSFFKEMNLVDDETGDSIASKLGKTIGAAINLAAYTVSSVVTGIDWSEIGRTIANVINGAVEETDWSQLGTTIANVFLVLPKTLYSVIVNTDWGEVASGLSKMLISACDSVSDWLDEVDWGDIAGALEEAIENTDWSGIATSFFTMLGKAFGGIGTIINEVIIDPIVDWVTDWANWGEENGPYDDLGMNILYGILNGIANAITNIGTWIYDNILTPFIDGFKSTFGINSPATNEELLAAAGYVGEGILNGIASVFANIGTWVQDNILTPISNALSGAESAVEVAVSLVKDGWSTVTKWIQNAGDYVVSSAVSLAKNGWSTVTKWVSSAATAVSSAVSLAKSGWTTATKWIQNAGSTAISSAVSLAKSGWSTVTKWIGSIPAVEAGIKLVKSGWKSLSSFIGSFTKSIGLTLTWKTSGLNALQKVVAKALFGSAKWPQLKFAARGGIVDRATLFGNTVAGEAGQEAIVPLERNTQWADIVATQIANKLASGSSGNQTVTINTYVTLDGKVVGKASADYAISQARATGQLPWAAYT